MSLEGKYTIIFDLSAELYKTYLNFQELFQADCIGLFCLLHGFLLRFEYKAWWKRVSVLA